VHSGLPPIELGLLRDDPLLLFLGRGGKVIQEDRNHHLQKDPADNDDKGDEENGRGTIQPPFGIRQEKQRTGNIRGPPDSLKGV